MANILYDENRKKEYRRAEKALLKKIPSAYRKKFKRQLQAELEGDGEQQVALGEELIAEGCSESSVLLSTARGYLLLDKPQSALTILSQIKESEPVIIQHRALCYQIQGKHEQVVELMKSIFPPEDYDPFFYTTYAFSARALGDDKLAYELYDAVKEHYVKEAYHPGVYFLDGVFQNLIELDLLYYSERPGHQEYLEYLEQHFREYMDFLSESEMDEREQDNIARNLLLFVQYMEEPAYRELFRDFLENIRSKAFLKLPHPRSAWYLSFVILESYLRYDDKQLSDYLEELVQVATEAFGVQYLSEPKSFADQEMVLSDEVDTRIMLLLLEYFAGKHWPGLAKEFRYLEETYPYSYGLIQEFAENMDADWKATNEQVFLELCRLEKIDTPEEQAYFRRYVESHYKETYESGTLVWDSDEQETYRRVEKKIGRNDPCPCGSGKKYKHCCGRNV